MCARLYQCVLGYIPEFSHIRLAIPAQIGGVYADDVVGGSGFLALPGGQQKHLLPWNIQHMASVKSSSLLRYESCM